MGTAGKHFNSSRNVIFTKWRLIVALPFGHGAVAGSIEFPTAVRPVPPIMQDALVRAVLHQKKSPLKKPIDRSLQQV
jgi:hypothetical protein